jgi:endonuclease/exonuclease/phosphatase (EEP) superfamily protein YafD
MVTWLEKVAIALASVWAITDSVFNLEDSWVLFAHRTLAPVLLVLVIIASLIAFIRLRSRVTWHHLLLQLLVVTACAAPVVRSLTLLPGPPSQRPGTAQALTLLSFNVFGFADITPSLIAEIKRLQPDIIALQEVTPPLADALQSDLGAAYPCQLLDPQLESWGMGVLSKFPCQPIPLTQPGLWVGRPQITKITPPMGPAVVIANMHVIHPHVALQRGPILKSLPRLTDTLHNREASMRSLLRDLEATSIPAAIITGDFNISMRSKTYETVVRAGYADSWLELHPLSSGGTWPFPGVGGTSFLAGLFRIDFVMHSRSLAVKSMELLPASLGSDHRGMFVRFEI